MTVSRRELLGMLGASAAGSSTAAPRVYPAPQEGGLSSDYRVIVNGVSAGVYRATTWQPPYGKPFGGPYSLCYFDMPGPVRVVVEGNRPLNGLRILPASKKIRANVRGASAEFTLDRPCHLSFEPDGKNGPLLLFANPAEREQVSGNTPGVRYFGPGVHTPGLIELKDDETLYIAGGAVVKGGVRASGKNIKILGRGILDGTDYPRFKGPTRYPVTLDGCTGVTVDGIIVRDGWSWNLVPRNSSDIEIRNVKVAGSKGENSDGINVVNSQRVRVHGCFVRTDDDSIATKGLDRNTRAPVDDVLVTDTVLWTDRAHIWRLGCECRAEAMRNLVFRNIDVIHWSDAWYKESLPMMISLQPAEDMPMEKVRFENIRVNGEGQKILIEVRPHATQWARKKTPGSISDVLFKNLSVQGTPGEYLVWLEGADPAHFVRNVMFDNVSRNGRRLERTSPNLRIVNEVSNVVFRG